MEPERWREIGRLYDDALECEERQRTVFLKEACASDEDLRLDLSHSRPRFQELLRRMNFPP